MIITLGVPSAAVAFVYWPILDSLTVTQRVDALMLWAGIAIPLYIIQRHRRNYR